MDTPTGAEVLADLLALVSTFMTQLTTWLGNLITFIIGQPYLMIGFVITVVSFAIGVLVRVARTIGHNPQ